MRKEINISSQLKVGRNMDCCRQL